MKQTRSRILAGIVAALATAGLIVGSNSPGEESVAAAPLPKAEQIKLIQSETTERPLKLAKIPVVPVVAETTLKTAEVKPQAKPAPKPKPKAKSVAPKRNIGANVDGGVWERIAACESSGNWSASNPSGKYTGGLQFDRATWLSNGGGKYAPYAGAATKAQQIEIANVVRSRRGLSPWECARKLGLA